MKRFLLSLAALAALWSGSAQAQCVGVGGINTVPQTGVVCIQESIVPSYAASTVNLATASTATDIACLTGSASRTVRLQRVVLSGVAGTAINVPMFVAKRASADTGGTSPTTIATGLPVVFAMDSTFAAPTATVVAYTANPTINDANWTTALANIVTAATVPFAATGTLIGQAATVIDFSVTQSVSPPVLRGVAQQICISMNTSGQTVSTPSGGLVSVSWLWTELTQ